MNTRQNHKNALSCSFQTKNAKSQQPIQRDVFPKLEKAKHIKTHQVVVSILYYTWTIDPTHLMAHSTFTSKQANIIKYAEKTDIQLLDYCVIHPDATIQCHTFDIILNIHNDASPLGAPGVKSCVEGHSFFFGNLTTCIPSASMVLPTLSAHL